MIRRFAWIFGIGIIVIVPIHSYAYAATSCISRSDCATSDICYFGDTSQSYCALPLGGAPGSIDSPAITAINQGLTSFFSNGGVSSTVKITPRLLINGTTSNAYAVGASWALTFTSNIASTTFTICAIINGSQSCTPNWGTTSVSGSWAQSGTFSSGNIGAWTEWLKFPGGVTSTDVTFTVSASGSPTRPTTPTSTINSDIGAYIWGKQYLSLGAADPIPAAVSFAAKQGLTTVRLALSPRSAIDYDISTSCNPMSLKQLAQGSEFQTAFSNPSISTIMLTTYDDATFSDCNTPKFLKPSFYNATNTAAVAQEYANLTTYLYQTYAKTGKTFIISNWEGDNQLYCDDAYDYGLNATIRSACNRNYATEYDGNATVASSTQGMIDWLNARDAGIAAGRAAAVSQGLTGVSVYSAVEFNIVHALHDNGYASVLYNVLPALTTKPDYISYSSYESINNATPGATLASDIALIKRVAGTNNLIIGEFGYDQLQVGSSVAQTDMKQVVNTVQQQGIQHAIAWQLLDQTTGGSDFGLFSDSGKPELYNALSGPNSQSPTSGARADAIASPVDCAVASGFPKTIIVATSTLNVRSAANTSASLAGSQTLSVGNTFVANNEVVGQSVNGNDLWWVSSKCDYVWSGGTSG